MTDTSASQSLQNLEHFSQLVIDLGEAVTRQRQVASSLGQASLTQSSNSLLRLITRINNSLDTLSRSLQTTEKEREQFRVMQEVGAVINSSLDRGEVLNTVMDSIISLTGAERGFLMLYDEESGELKVEVARNINRETIGESSFEISRSIVRSVAETGTPVVTTNAQEDERYKEKESIIHYNLRSILCVPLKIKDNIIGVIYADNRVVSGIFVDSDRDLLAAFSNQAAVAIENARLFRQIRDQLADITELKNLQDDVFGSIASGVITIDLEDKVLLYNRAAEQILGVPEEEVLEEDYRSFLTEPLGEIVETIIEGIQAEGGNHNMELETELRNRPGSSNLNLTFSPLRDIHQETRGVALVVNDVSEKKRLESVRRYLPPVLVDRVRDLDQAQKAQRREITVMFADIRGFSTWSEPLEPELIIEVINGHLSVAASAVIRYEGMIDKLAGDAVMALYNTPLNPQEDHVERAVKTAFEIRQRLLKHHQSLPEENRLFFGIGINSGQGVVGNVGSALRKDYSAMGNSINLAKRLQELASPNQILLSEKAYLAAKDWVVANKLKPVQVKGRQAKENIYELIEKRSG